MIRINIKNKMIVEELGFNIISENKNEKICEGLDFFNFIKIGIKIFELYSDFFKFVVEDLKKMGFKTLFGSCEEKTKLFYREAGFKFIDKTELNRKIEYLVKKEL